MTPQDFNFNLIKVVPWHWTQDEYSFMGNPRPQHGFLAVLKGKLEYVLEDGRQFVLKKGDFIYLPKHATYRVRFYIKEGSVDTLLVNFDFSDSVSLPIPPFFYANDPTRQIETTLEKLFSLSDEEFYLKKAYFYLCFHLVYRYISHGDKDTPDFITKAKSLLAESDEPVERIAAELGLSSSYFRKRFKEEVGISPAGFRIDKRLEEAKRLLLSTDLSTDEIALRTGFYDTPYFYKKFRDRNGTTPKKYRSMNRIF